MSRTGRTGCVVLLAALLISARLGTSTADWVSDLTGNINRMTQNINEQVQGLTRDLREQIRHNVESSLQPALREANRTIEGLPRDAYGRIISNNGNIISINSGNGISRTIMSGYTANGEPYVRDIEERYEGNILYHNETTVNLKSRATERIRWKLDLSIPGAKPEILSEEQ